MSLGFAAPVFPSSVARAVGTRRIKIQSPRPPAWDEGQVGIGSRNRSKNESSGNRRAPFSWSNR
jgi:hypothetical protein